MLELKNITFKVDNLDGKGEITILDNVSFKIEQGKILIITGPNGGGKSTLAKYLSHILEMEDLETDDFIVKREDMTINEIFQRKG